MGLQEVMELLKVLVGLVWPLVILFVALIFFNNIRALCSAFISRFERDEIIKIGTIEFKGAIIRGEREAKEKGIDVFDDKNVEIRAATRDDFEHRRLLRYKSRFVRLVHRVLLTADKQYPYRVLAYLKIEELLPRLDQDKSVRPGRINDIDFVEYYLGKYFGTGEWGSWFVVRNGDHGFAIEYLTDDEVTCIAKVHFHNGDIVDLVRFLDLEMGEIVRSLEDQLKERAEELQRPSFQKAI